MSMKPDKQVLLTAIERLIQAHERYEKVRLLNPQQFQELYLKNIRENIPFDQLIDELPGKGLVPAVEMDDCLGR
jgi:hypothetical protein